MVSGSLHYPICSYPETVPRLTVKARANYRSPTKQPCQQCEGVPRGNTDYGVNGARCADKRNHQHTVQVAALVPNSEGLAFWGLVSGILGGWEQILVQTSSS